MISASQCIVAAPSRSSASVDDDVLSLFRKQPREDESILLETVDAVVGVDDRREWLKIGEITHEIHALESNGVRAKPVDDLPVAAKLTQIPRSAC